MKIDLFIPLLRNVLLVIVGLLIQRGYVDQSLSEPIIGAGLGLITTGWYLFDRRKINKANKKAVVAAEVVAEAVGAKVKDLPVSKDAIKSIVKTVAKGA